MRVETSDADTAPPRGMRAQFRTLSWPARESRFRQPPLSQDPTPHERDAARIARLRSDKMEPNQERCACRSYERGNGRYPTSIPVLPMRRKLLPGCKSSATPLPRILNRAVYNRFRHAPRNVRASPRSRCDGSGRHRKGSWQRMHLGGESDTPEKSERRAKSDDAKRGNAFRCKPAKMPALQNRGVKQPDADRANHLHTRQQLPDKKTADESERIQRKSPPQQPGDRREEIAQRRSPGCCGGDLRC